MTTRIDHAGGNFHRWHLAEVAVVVLAVFSLDQLSKWLMIEALTRSGTVALLPFFNLSLGFNSGISFGMFAEVFMNRPALLAGLKSLIVVGLVIWALRSLAPWERRSLAMIAGGALGNIVDRLRQGAVTDFLDFHWADMHWPTFNIADVAICLGVVTLLVSTMLAPADRKPS